MQIKRGIKVNTVSLALAKQTNNVPYSIFYSWICWKDGIFLLWSGCEHNSSTCMPFQTQKISQLFRQTLLKVIFFGYRTNPFQFIWLSWGRECKTTAFFVTNNNRTNMFFRPTSKRSLLSTIQDKLGFFSLPNNKRKMFHL